MHPFAILLHRGWVILVLGLSMLISFYIKQEQKSTWIHLGDAGLQLQKMKCCITV